MTELEGMLFGMHSQGAFSIAAWLKEDAATKSKQALSSGWLDDMK
jgi:hypothetical protein